MTSFRSDMPGRGRGPLLCLVALMLLSPPGHAAEASECDRHLSQYRVSYWQQEDGLPLNSVYALEQDDEGFLWIGTEAGLTRFDGVSFEHVDMARAATPAPEFITSLALDDQGRMLIGTGTAGVFAAFDGRLERLPDIDSGYIQESGIVIGSNGEAWISILDRGLVELAGESPTRIDTSSGLAGSTVTAVAARTEGGFWIGMEDERIQYYHQGTVHDAALPESLAGIYVETLLQSSGGELWIGSREGLFRYHAGEVSRFGPEEGLSDDFIKDIMEDDEGRIWVGTAGAGLGRLCGDAFQMLDASEGLTIGMVQDVMQDREGSIWLATGSSGIVQLSKGAAVPLTAEQGLPAAPVLPIIQAPDGAVWIGTFGGGVVRWASGESTVFGTADGLSDDRVLTLASSSNGGIWVGTRGGLDLIRSGRVVESYSDELPHTTIPSILREGDTLWIGTIDGVARLEAGSLETVSPASGSYGGPVVNFFRDAAGTLWISSDGGGLFRLVDGIPERSALESRLAFDLTDDGRGGLWIATAAGLVHWDGEREVRVTQEDGLPTSQFFSVLTDGDGGLWLSSNLGVTRVVREDLERFVGGEDVPIRYRHFDESDGMPRAETNGGFRPTVMRDLQGRHWYPTSDGVAIFDPTSLAEALPAPPRPVITAVIVDATRVPSVSRVELPPNPGLTEIAYTAPTFRNPEKLEFRYRLVGYDPDWYRAGGDREALYRQLPPGEFEFELQVRESNGPWSGVRSMQLSVDWMYYESPWFWSAIGLVSALLLGLVLTYESRRRARIRERRQQAQKIEAIGMLSSGIAHDFNNILAAISGSTDVLLASLPENSGLRKYADSVSRAAARGAGLTRQLLAFGRQQSAEPQWVDLSAELSSLKNLLRPLLPDTIDMTVDIQESVGECFIDPVHVQQIVLNLVINARDAMQQGGTIHLKLARRSLEDTAGSATHQRGQRFACIVIEDTGTGMDAATRARIFEPFFTTKPAGLGTGLGLSVIHGIVQDAGGYVDVRSRPGAGTAVHVCLPVSRRGSDPSQENDDA
ncbi:hybrid sensor histidine kinase/response regulator [Halomonas denitrificans]|nr:hypothetical protein [Halomonas denitrificans]